MLISFDILFSPVRHKNGVRFSSFFRSVRQTDVWSLAPLSSTSNFLTFVSVPARVFKPLDKEEDEEENVVEEEKKKRVVDKRKGNKVDDVDKKTRVLLSCLSSLPLDPASPAMAMAPKDPSSECLLAVSPRLSKRSATLARFLNGNVVHRELEREEEEEEEEEEREEEGEKEKRHGVKWKHEDEYEFESRFRRSRIKCEARCRSAATCTPAPSSRARAPVQ